MSQDGAEVEYTVHAIQTPPYIMEKEARSCFFGICVETVRWFSLYVLYFQLIFFLVNIVAEYDFSGDLCLVYKFVF